MGGGGVSTQVVISGTLDEVYRKLLAAKVVTTHRKYSGWVLFHPDEQWIYQSENDDRVCPWCLSYESYFGSGLSGVIVPSEFPQWRREHPHKAILNNEIYPNTHELDRVPAKGICRCVLHFVDYLTTLAERLMTEIGDMTA